MRTYIQINPADNVVVAVKNLQTGASLDINGRTIVVLQDIPAGHKVALQDFKEGDHIIKYGAPIGHAREVITTGSWVNEKNCRLFSGSDRLHADDGRYFLYVPHRTESCENRYR